MARMILIACMMTLVATAPAAAADANGVWLAQDGDVKMRISACEGAICGTIVWLLEPNDPETGQPQTDRLNPDQKLRARPILDLPVILGMQRNGNDKMWSGSLYNPEDGKLYQGTVELLLNDRLIRVRTCASKDCPTQVWTRINSAEQPVQQSALQSVQQSAEKPAQQSARQPVQQSALQSAQQITPRPVQQSAQLTAQQSVQKKAVAPYRRPDYGYVKVPKYRLNCFLLFCLQEAIGYDYVQSECPHRDE